MKLKEAEVRKWQLNYVYSIAIVFFFFFIFKWSHGNPWLPRMKHFFFWPCWPNLLIKQGKDKTAEERRIAICIFDDVVEHCREAALKYAFAYFCFIEIVIGSWFHVFIQFVWADTMIRTFLSYWKPAMMRAQMFVRFATLIRTLSLCCQVIHGSHLK